MAGPLAAAMSSEWAGGPQRDGYTAEKTAAFFDDLAGRLRQAPGVSEVALSRSVPFGPQAALLTLRAPAANGAPGQLVSGVAENTVGPRYFAGLSAPVLAGREFDLRDQRLEPSQDQVLPVIVNQTAARAFFGAGQPLGRRISDAGKSYVVVGVVRDLSAPMSENAAGDDLTAVPVVYLPLTKSDFSHSPAAGDPFTTGGTNGIIVMVRSSRSADAMLAVRAELARMDPDVLVFDVHTLAGKIADSLSYVRYGEYVYGGVGVFGLVLAAIGLAGVTAYSVARRRKEIGIRMALGARQGQVLGLVLREGASLVAAGSALGLAAALTLSRALPVFSNLFGPAFQAGSHDARLLLGAPLLLAFLAMLACYIPARRSAQIDPLRALRDE